MALTASGDDVAAAKVLAQLTTERPEDPEPWLLLAELLMAHHAYRHAGQVLDTAACRVRERQRWEIAFMRVRMLVQLGKRTEAGAMLQQLLDSPPDDHVASPALGSEPWNKLFLWASTWVHALERRKPEALQSGEGYLAQFCSKPKHHVGDSLPAEGNENSSDCQAVTSLIRCLKGWCCLTAYSGMWEEDEYVDDDDDNDDNDDNDDG